MMTFKKVLVPVDFSPPSRTALKLALGIASRFDASIEILHAVEYPVYAIPDMTVSIAGAAPMSWDLYAQDTAENEMRKLLDGMASEVARAGVRVTSRVIRGNARETILETAKNGGFDLIVMGTHGRKGIDHLLLGSVAERVVRKASCPVLTTREPTS
jgi:nucleotide-binding universal stress UspA family protein